MFRVVVLALSLAASAALSLNVHTAPLRPNILGVLRSSSPICASKNKGFGSASAAAPKKKKKKKNSSVAMPSVAADASAPPPAAPTASATTTNESMEARGRAMLEQMRQEAGSAPVSAKRDKMVLTEEELTPINPDEGVMPQEVADRMLARIIPFAAAPIVLAVFVFAGFWYANTQLMMDLPPQIVAYATQACLLLSFAGITFGVMSTNLEEGGEQQMLGLDNVQKSLDNMRGVEDARIAETKRDIELDDALADGVILSQAAKKKREQQ